MTRFAFLSPPYAGHLNPMTALAKGLVARGHGATFVAQVDVGPKVAGQGIAFRPVGGSTHPAGSLGRATSRLSGTTGLFGILGVIRDVARTTDMLCRDGEGALRELGIEAIIADQTEAAGGLLARRLGLPLVSVANALLINREPLIPPPFVGWPYDASDWGLSRNRGGYRVADFLMRPIEKVIRGTARRWDLPPLRSIEDCLSATLQISQSIQNFDFPRRAAPAALVHVGPLRGPDTETFMPPDGRPLVFCSLGTLQGARFGVFETVARACERLGVSLVIAHGGKLRADQVARLPGQPIVKAFVPQRLVMAHAAAVITHGGLNTVLDALSAGVPLIVVPIAFEQGAIAARVERSGAGLTMPLRQLTSGRLSTLLRQVLEVPIYRQRAEQLRQESSGAGGVARAVGLIEAMLAMPPQDAAIR